MLTAEHTGWVKDYRAVLLTMESLEATAFTAADWRGIIHLQDLWPSVHSTKEGKRRPPLGYYTRYAYLAAAWRTLRLDSALHIELDVILTATLSELCAATGWPDAYGRARLDATAAMHVRVKNSMERCPAPTSYGSVHASFMKPNTLLLIGEKSSDTTTCARAPTQGVTCELLACSERRACALLQHSRTHCRPRPAG